MIIGTEEPDIVEGMVHICYDGHWGMAIGPSWTLREASVVCRQLHYAPVALKAFTYSTNSTAILQFYCVGYEKKIFDCDHPPLEYYKNSYSHVAAAGGVKCQGENILNQN